MKVGTKLRVSAQPVDADGNPGVVDGDAVQFVADNGAQVAPLDGFNAIVIIAAAGKTTISSKQQAGGVDIPSDQVVEDAQANATRVLLTVTVDAEAPAA